MTRRAGAALGPTVLIALVALFLLPLALGHSFWLRDTLEFTYPLKEYLRERLAHGALALWNPRLGLGRPFAGVVQPGVFYPLDVVLLLPYPRGVDAFFAVHAFIAALGMRAWLRARGNDETAAVLGGAVFALSGYYVSMLVGSGTYAVGAAWMPWALARPASAVRLGWTLALMVLGGDPQAAWLTAILVVILALAGPADASGKKRALVAAAAGFVVAGALCAVQLGPALEVARVGRPGGVPLADAQHFSFAPLRLVELVWPDAFGPRYGADWLVHPLYDEGTGMGYEPWAAGIYVGLATPLLALAAVARRRRRAGDLALAIAAAVAVAVALGRHAPVFALWHRVVPGASIFRYPEKYLLVTTLVVAALAGEGLARVVAQPRRALAVGGAFVALLAIGWLWTRHGGAAFFAARLGRLEHGSVDELADTLASAARHAVLVAVALLVPLALAAIGKLSPRATSLALAALVVADLFAQSLALTDYVPSSLYREPPPPVVAMRQLAGPGLVRVYRPLLLDFATGLPLPVALRATLRPDVGVDDGLGQLDAYDNFVVPVESELWDALRRAPARLVAVTATRFVLVPPRLFAPQAGFVERGRWPALGAVLGEVTDRSPRVYLAHDARVDDRFVAAGDFVPGQSLALSEGAPAHAAGDCTLVDDRVERLVLRCHASAPSYAVVADTYFPGWSATVDGAATPIVRANIAMRAVPVPAGEQVVELRYRPFGLVAGAIVSLLTLIGLACRRLWRAA